MTSKISHNIEFAGGLLNTYNSTPQDILTALIHYCNDKGIDFTEAYQKACKQANEDRTKAREEKKNVENGAS